MKKFTIVLMLIVISACFAFIPSSASGGSAPAGKNYLSLSNLKVHPYQYWAETISHIRLVKNQYYTLVIDFDTLGENVWSLDDLWIEVEFFPYHQAADLYFQADMANSRAYLEFQAMDIDLRIAKMPIDDFASGYNIILYQGHYAQFPGFEPYLNPYDQVIVEGVLPMDYDQRVSIENIQSMIVAKDPIGNVLPKTIETDTYTASNQLPGEYQIVFSTLYNQIRKRYVLDIKIYDLTAPVIHTDGVINISFSERLSVEEIIDTLTVTDNVDTMSTSSLIILEDTYSSAATVGEYHVKLRAVDHSGNQSETTLTIQLVDYTGPVISGPSSIYIYTTDTPLSNAQILSKFTAFDNVDGAIGSLFILQNNYAQKTIAGRYDVGIAATDAQGNTSIMNINVHVVDNRSPNFVVDTQILSGSIAQNMTDAEIIEWFKAQMNGMGMSVSHVRIVYNEYSNQKETVGQHYIYLSYAMNEEEVMTRILVDVEEQSHPIPYYIWIPLSMMSVAIVSVLYLKLKKK